MMLVKTKKELFEKLQMLREKGSIGFVPTMGALHRGHLSLVDFAARENPVVVVSIFVNPTQFNDPDDLKRYPRDLEADLELLKTTGCNLVFAPEAAEMYPEPDTRKFDFGHLEQVMEGKHRPGHFNGVAQVVSKFFEIVQPDRAYFGQKDFQQLAVVKMLVRLLNLPVEIVACPIIREKSGLAMSSRNELLSPEERENASLIFDILSQAKNLTGEKSVEGLVNWVIENINKNPFLNVEYFEVVDSENLQPVKTWEEKGEKTGCIAVHCGKVRLIDNIVLN
ncbi:pantoate--beta-alanine ligase [Mariniphaga sediminis]|uniref:Pantothenate synthetase n=1 Tax=Mariniphaga sediminis TaxID=1628158 RepID=A0A399D3R6_9BACT|nr:pantoate--beta-alanine ligase [Mariniphaga sediminis]RIH66217.1 pantoate--beta-alanine ligase [Mariniphaga sediminis]